MAKLLSKSVGGVAIDHDELRSAFLDAGVEFERAASLAYNQQFALAEDSMQSGMSVIIDSTCNFAQVLQQGAALAEKYGYAYWYVECRAAKGVVNVEQRAGRLSALCEVDGQAVPARGQCDYGGRYRGARDAARRCTKSNLEYPYQDSARHTANMMARIGLDPKSSLYFYSELAIDAWCNHNSSWLIGAATGWWAMGEISGDGADEF
ncbi:hypothetical protein LLEC1_03621 [Akanthomyces lecanii]|uniref:Uncharacterized protein n=1 Tax=Cordyceps confragosa TaxID=2714763 RepID=A0A179I5Z6_CORDF|nr:hypothetical protein LLEC1_03621 [Akanthomyces lecanii]